MPVLICHTVWMPYYSGEEEVHPGGFDYVRDEGYGHELFNFKDFGGACYGYVQARSIKIDRLGAGPRETFVDGVTVIWTAPKPNGPRVLVGWYREARVYRHHQVGRLAGRTSRGARVGYYVQAASSNCYMIPSEQRSLAIRHNERGFPGQSSVFYPEESDNPQMGEWLKEAFRLIEGWNSEPIGSGELPGRTAGKQGGWPVTPDVARNAAVEASAISIVRDHFGCVHRDRQKDNCGWDIEFKKGGRTICVEVKGLSGTAVAVELTPNEFSAMQRAMAGGFHEGDYRLAVVCNALKSPQLHIFRHEEGLAWRCELTSRLISAELRTGAKLT